MEYHFESNQDYFLFQDTFYYYLKYENNPFCFYIESKMDYKERCASHYIGEAHYNLFCSKLGTLGLTSLAKAERESRFTVFRELNIAIIRNDLENNRNNYSCETEREVWKHQPLFPCVYQHDKECFLSLPEEFELLLDHILTFENAIIRSDINELVDFLMLHYQGLDNGWIKERLSFLSNYYQADKHLIKRHETLLEHRRQRL